MLTGGSNDFLDTYITQFEKSITYYDGLTEHNNYDVEFCDEEVLYDLANNSFSGISYTNIAQQSPGAETLISYNGPSESKDLGWLHVPENTDIMVDMIKALTRERYPSQWRSFIGHLADI
jgi:hypothetical protein